MRTTIAFKMVTVYLILVTISLLLAGFLSNRAIQGYVIDSTRTSLVSDGWQVIHDFEAYGQTLHGTHAATQVPVQSLTVAAQSVKREYIVVDPSGQIYWNTFSASDFPLLSKVSASIMQALRGKVTSGVYPQNNPVYEFVAIPFSYEFPVPALQSHPGLPQVLPLPSEGTTDVSVATKVVAVFAKIADLQRITSQIWLSVTQGLVIASLVTAIVGVILARRLMRPVAVIRTAIERVRERDFAYVPVVHTRDEWADVASALSNMMQSLQAFDEGQKRFLQNASHELKTPLMAIRGYAEGLRDGVFEPSESFRILDIVAQESVRLKSLVDELIYLSKLETLSEVYTFVQYDCALMIYKSIERVHPLAKERRILILTDVPEDPVLALVDRDKMVQALLNLISNAIRHARRQVFIRLVRKDKVTLIVEDDGDGFRERDVDLVFERFFHGAKGETGLGLPIAKAIIEKHGGEIYAENADGGGARFVIQLP